MQQFLSCGLANSSTKTKSIEIFVVLVLALDAAKAHTKAVGFFIDQVSPNWS